MVRQADYRSPEFYNIIDCINDALRFKGLDPLNDWLISPNFIKKSKIDTGKYGNQVEWRITHRNAPQLFDSNGDIMNFIKDRISLYFSQYIMDRTIRFGNPKYTKDFKGLPMASIVILLTQLPDNIITTCDLDLFLQGDSKTKSKCYEIESRMFKRDGDLRSQDKRIFDFALALKYEPVMETTPLLNISNLKLMHQDDVVTLEADPNADFTGFFGTTFCKLEGKATELDRAYIDSPAGHATFANYFIKRLNSGSFGSIHDADYVLLFLRNTKEVICIELANPINNWRAGKLDF